MKKYLILLLSLTLFGCGGGDGGSGTYVAAPTPTIDPAIKTLTATGVRVIDGDTLEVLLANAPSERIRMLGIDAPESDQPYGKESALNLQRCVANATVTVEWKDKDAYSRILGKVKANGNDCNFKQVNDGAAWHYKEYQNQQTAEDRLSYANAETFARNAKRGLWANCAIAPWDWRRGVRTCSSLPTYTSPSTSIIPTPTQPSGDYCSALRSKSCGQMANCSEAYTALSCGNISLDGDKDGKPCESLCP